MKATGIVRALDQLGRIVLPIELRRVLNINPGDKVEIFTGDDGHIILRKFCYQGEVLEAVNKIGTYADELTPAKAAALQEHLKGIRDLMDTERSIA